MQNKIKLPELLAPAGSPLALRAAIEGGADAIYMGGAAFNARINAKNFTPDELREGISLAHSYGVKVYITANTLIFDREREDYLRAAELAYLAGADALIVADIGMARELKKRIPIDLHASTQLSGHNTDAARLLADAGFSRMVCAREMSRDDLYTFCKSSPIEAEVFVHGALCVSTSGQCLFSSAVGGRSGNRGECAQPCRLPYTVKGRQAYPLSLCDLSLAEHITELCDMGVSSFKIEGRMKSPEYVRDVVSIWRRLIDENRNADKRDMSRLAEVFSRGGFTDGYYSKRINSSMLGIRSEADKRLSAELSPFERITRRIPIEFSASLKKGAPISLSASLPDRTVCVTGDIPQEAINAPLTREVVERNLSKLGNTPYSLTSLSIDLDEGIMLPISSLNALRRAAVDALSPICTASESDIKRLPLNIPERRIAFGKTAIFYRSTEIPEEAWEFFDKIFVPLEDCPQKANEKLGVMLPEVIFDSQREQIEKMLLVAKERGICNALFGNLGHLEMLKKYGFELYGDLRLNVTNASSVAFLNSLGINDVILSPELTLAQIRGLSKASVRATVYGRLPLMLTEKCVGKELGSCNECQSGKLSLTDRKGVCFPVRMRYAHRSVIFNSVPIYMADRRDDLARAGVRAEHFIFSTESRSEAAQIIRAYQNGSAPKSNAIKRIK